MKHWPMPARGDDDASDRRPDGAGGVDHDAVEGDRVADVVGADHLHHERLAARVVERGDRAEADGERVDHPQLDRAGERDDAECHRERAGRELGADDEVPLVEAVGEHAADRCEEQRR